MADLITTVLAVTVIILVIVIATMSIFRRSNSNIDMNMLESKFKNTATDVLDKNSAKFKETATEPMKEMMDQLKNDIGNLQDKFTENTTLVDKLDTHTSKLTEILSNTKLRGNFGEMIIEKWFDAAGLQKGVTMTLKWRCPMAQNRIS